MEVECPAPFGPWCMTWGMLCLRRILSWYRRHCFISWHLPSLSPQGSPGGTTACFSLQVSAKEVTEGVFHTPANVSFVMATPLSHSVSQSVAFKWSPECLPTGATICMYFVSACSCVGNSLCTPFCRCLHALVCACGFQYTHHIVVALPLKCRCVKYIVHVCAWVTVQLGHCVSPRVHTCVPFSVPGCF